MKIEIPGEFMDEIEDQFVLLWLRYIKGHNPEDYKDKEDREFWAQMSYHAAEILRLNWFEERDD